MKNKVLPDIKRAEEHYEELKRLREVSLISLLLPVVISINFSVSLKYNAQEMSDFISLAPVFQVLFGLFWFGKFIRNLYT